MNRGFVERDNDGRRMCTLWRRMWSWDLPGEKCDPTPPLWVTLQLVNGSGDQNKTLERVFQSCILIVLSPLASEINERAAKNKKKGQTKDDKRINEEIHKMH